MSFDNGPVLPEGIEGVVLHDRKKWRMFGVTVNVLDTVSLYSGVRGDSEPDYCEGDD